MRSVSGGRPSATSRISWMRPRGPSFSSPGSVYVGHDDVHRPQWMQVSSSLGSMLAGTVAAGLRSGVVEFVRIVEGVGVHRC